MEHKSAFYNDDRFLTVEHALLTASTLGFRGIHSPHVKRHINEGFAFRLQMMQTNRIFMRENTKSEDSFRAHVWIEFSIHLNSYYLNLRGALDNLAWALNYQFDIIPGSTEGSKSRMHCNLFGSQFLANLKQISQPLFDNLSNYIEWERKLRDLRDPAAHRIPLTPIGGVLIGEERLKEFRRLETLAAQPEENLGGLPRSHYLIVAQQLAKYMPLFKVSSDQSHDHLHIPTQVAADHDIFLIISEAALGILLPNTAG